MMYIMSLFINHILFFSIYIQWIENKLLSIETPVVLLFEMLVEDIRELIIEFFVTVRHYTYIFLLLWYDMI